MSCLHCPLTVVDVASGEGCLQRVFVPLHWCSSVTVTSRLFSIQCDVRCIHNWMIFCFVNLVPGVWKTWKNDRQAFFILNWANFYFTNLPWAVQWKTAKMYSGSKTLHSACSGNYSPSSADLASVCLGAERALLWMRKKGQEKEERKMGASASVSLALEGIDLFVDWWEEQHCLWDPEWLLPSYSS